MTIARATHPAGTIAPPAACRTTPRQAASQRRNVRTEDLAGLRHLARRLGDRFVAGYVLYTGQQTLPFGGRLRAVPIEALWRVSP